MKKYFIVSLNVHLESKDEDKRKRQFKKLLELSRKIFEFRIYDFTVFFSGDANSRLTEDEKLLLENIKIEKKNKIEIKNEINKSGEFDINKIEKEDSLKEDLLQIKDYISFSLEKEEFRNFISLYNFEENLINFQPTYKLNFDHDLNCYEEINFIECYEKIAYTDRIFFFSTLKENNFFSGKYDIIKSKMVSDHLTVFGIFFIEEKDIFTRENINLEINFEINRLSKNKIQNFLESFFKLHKILSIFIILFFF